MQAVSRTMSQALQNIDELFLSCQKIDENKLNMGRGKLRMKPEDGIASS
jgi:hypothetical protein